jgi:hypothetical protein
VALSVIFTFGIGTNRALTQLTALFGPRPKSRQNAGGPNEFSFSVALVREPIGVFAARVRPSRPLALHCSALADNAPRFGPEKVDVM